MIGAIAREQASTIGAMTPISQARAEPPDYAYANRAAALLARFADEEALSAVDARERACAIQAIENALRRRQKSLLARRLILIAVSVAAIAGLAILVLA